MSSPHGTTTGTEQADGTVAPQDGVRGASGEEPSGGAEPRTEGHRQTALAIGMVTVDCEHPQDLAGFWQRALGTEPTHESADLVILPGTPRLAFQRVDRSTTGKNRIHLDLSGTDRTTEVARLVELGAEVVRTHDVEGVAWTVMRDPAGNEFCVTDGED